MRSAVTWSLPDRKSSPPLPPEALLELRFFRQVRQVTWHAKGDYFATVLAQEAQNRAVIIHQVSGAAGPGRAWPGAPRLVEPSLQVSLLPSPAQLSRWRSQVPFSKSRGSVQCVLFHPTRPYLFVATQVRCLTGKRPATQFHFFVCVRVKYIVL